MRRLLLIRHASPARDLSVLAREWALSPEGQADAEKLAVVLADYTPAAIISSDEVKARQTAQPLADRLRLPVEIASDLHEHERRTSGYLAADVFAATMARFFAEPETLVFGEETARQALTRFGNAVEATLASHPEGNLAFFTHGTVLSLFVAAHSLHSALDFWRVLGMPAWVVFSIPNIALVETHLSLLVQ